MSYSTKVCLSTALLASCLHMATANATTMLGAYVDYDGWNTAVIDQFNADATKPLAVVNLFSSFSQDWSYLTTQTTNIVSRNAAPMITWMPSTAARPNDNLLTEISSGQWNTYIDNWISGLKAWQATYPSTSKPTVLIRFAHEFNGNWYPWSNTPDAYIAAWRYLYNRFSQAGVTNVEWVWCPNNGSVDSYSDITRYYPGNDVVQWTGLDGYNWGSNYSFSSWKSFAETFSSPYTKLVANYPTKPILIAEVASAEPSDMPNAAYGQDGNDSDVGQSKEVWVQDMYTRIMSEYPAIRAVSWFNTNKELSWGLNGAGNTGLSAYNSTILNSYYTGTFTALSTTTTTSTNTSTKTKGRKTTSATVSATTAVDDTTTDTSLMTADDFAVSQQLVALSYLPTVVGENLLKREAEGFRRLSAEHLSAIRKVRSHQD